MSSVPAPADRRFYDVALDGSWIPAPEDPGQGLAARQAAICEGQLSFGPEQGVLSEAEPEPQQLALLPEPPPWEQDPGLPASLACLKGGRMSRKHSRAGTFPGQTALF